MDILLKYFSDFSPLQLQQWKALEPLYREWNEKINVISRNDVDHLYEKHVLHSLSIAAVFSFRPGQSILDLGTGGGFPGIPLAIYFPEVQFHLVDSIGKKIKVVQAVIDALGLKNVTAEQIRAEQLRPRLFDTVVSRAVAPLKELWQWSKPLLHKKADPASGYGLICLKGGDLAEEISASGCRPRIVDLFEVFPEPYFTDKFLLHITR
jgi:16S rRNA (guanine527-N7)-methyltransferase